MDAVCQACLWAVVQSSELVWLPSEVHSNSTAALQSLCEATGLDHATTFQEPVSTGQSLAVHFHPLRDMVEVAKACIRYLRLQHPFLSGLKSAAAVLPDPQGPGSDDHRNDRVHKHWIRADFAAQEAGALLQLFPYIYAMDWGVAGAAGRGDLVLTDGAVCFLVLQTQYIDPSPGESKRAARSAKRKKVQEAARKYRCLFSERCHNAGVVLGASFTNDRGLQYLHPGSETVLAAMAALLGTLPPPPAITVPPSPLSAPSPLDLALPASIAAPVTAPATAGAGAVGTGHLSGSICTGRESWAAPAAGRASSSGHCHNPRQPFARQQQQQQQHESMCGLAVHGPAGSIPARHTGMAEAGAPVLPAAASGGGLACQASPSFTQGAAPPSPSPACTASSSTAIGAAALHFTSSSASSTERQEGCSSPPSGWCRPGAAPGAASGLLKFMDSSTDPGALVGVLQKTVYCLTEDNSALRLALTAAQDHNERLQASAAGVKARLVQAEAERNELRQQVQQLQKALMLQQEMGTRSRALPYNSTNGQQHKIAEAAAAAAAGTGGAVAAAAVAGNCEGPEAGTAAPLMENSTLMVVGGGLLSQELSAAAAAAAAAAPAAEAEALGAAVAAGEEAVATALAPDAGPGAVEAGGGAEGGSEQETRDRIRPPWRVGKQEGRHPERQMSPTPAATAATATGRQHDRQRGFMSDEMAEMVAEPLGSQLLRRGKSVPGVPSALPTGAAITPAAEGGSLACLQAGQAASGGPSKPAGVGPDEGGEGAAAAAAAGAGDEGGQAPWPGGPAGPSVGAHGAVGGVGASSTPGPLVAQALAALKEKLQPCEVDLVGRRSKRQTSN